MLDVCLCVYNNLAYTYQFIEFIQKFTKIDHKFIIVDDGSTDGTAAYLASLDKEQFTVITNTKNSGYVLSINKALAASTSEFICVANNDILISPNCLDVLVEIVSKFGLWCVSPTMLASDTCTFDQEKGDWVAWSITNADHYVRQTMLGGILGACFVMPRVAYDTVGGFDERFSPFWFEDRDYELTLIDAGHAPVTTHRVFIYHYLNTTLRLTSTEHREKVWEESRQKFIEKWNDKYHFV